MSMIHAFPKWLYAQVLLGMVTYAAAMRSPLLLVGGVLGALSWWLVERPDGRPLPRWLVNLGVLGGTVWLGYNQFVLERPLIINLGWFIMLLQLLKLYERKRNRDYGQLVVLSLLQVLCAMIVGATVEFAALLMAYMGVALWTILLYQLKRGHDEAADAAAAQALSERPVALRPAAASGRLWRHFRATAAFCGLGTAAVGSALFVAIPRGQPGMIAGWEGYDPRPVSGFNDEVRLDGGRRIAENQQPVMNVRLSRDGRPIGSDEMSFLLRGAVLDHYDRAAGRWDTGAYADGYAASNVQRGYGGVELRAGRGGGAPLVQDVTLRSRTRDGLLFAVSTPVRVATEPYKMVGINGIDRVIRVMSRGGSGGSLHYTVVSHDEPPDGRTRRRSRYRPPRRYAHGPVLDDPRLAELARSTLEEAGPRREPGRPAAQEGARFAAAIERRLRREFRYTLDVPAVPEGEDPILAFLFRSRAGHCEYFASAMCAMLRSVGVRSRVVTGYRASEYNDVGGYYIVRERNAHAWVEAWHDGVGWVTYDPSPPADIADIHRPAGGAMAALGDLYDFIEFQWINHVITYDNPKQQTLMGGLHTGLRRLVASGRRATRTAFGGSRRGDDRAGLWGALTLAVGFIPAALAAVVLVRRWRSGREALRCLGLHAFGRADRHRLAARLAFYMRMLRLLRRAGFEKRPSQTPAGFARELVRERGRRFESVAILTDMFYEVRFGGRPLDDRRQRLITEQLARLRRAV